MGKGPARQRKEVQPQNPPTEEVSAISDSSDAEGMSNTDEIHQDGAYSGSALRQASPMQVELESEDSVTCQWDDCGIVFTHLPTLIEHIHNGEYEQWVHTFVFDF